MASGRLGFPSDTDTPKQYREAYERELRPMVAQGPMRNANMPVLIESASICASDVISIRGRLARIAALLGKHVPIKDSGAGPTTPPTSMLEQLATINNVQRDAIDSANSLLAEIEQALGL